MFEFQEALDAPKGEDGGLMQETDVSDPKILARLENLERQALECVEKGLAPPREVYDVANRFWIHWTRFPGWAWPNDPELFDSSPHEG